jgi:hypothetical protein
MLIAGAEREPFTTLREVDRAIAKSPAPFSVFENTMPESFAGHLRASQRDLVPHLRGRPGHALGDIEFKESEFAVCEQSDVVIRILIVPRRDLRGVDRSLIKEMES